MKYIDFKELLKDLDIEEQSNFIKIMNERTFFLKDTTITSRVYNLWKNAGLVDSAVDSDSRKWVKLSFLEYIWLNIVKDLRAFGVPFESIKGLKKELLNDVEIVAPEAIDESKLEKIMVELLSAKENCSLEKAEQMLEEIKKESNVGSLYQLIRKQMGKNFTMLALNLGLSAFKNSDSILVIYLVEGSKESETHGDAPEGGILHPLAYHIYNELFFTNDAENKKAKEVLFSKPHIELNLSHYIASFIRAHLTKSKEIGWLNEDEANLISLVREGKANTITIKFKNRKAETLEVTKSRHGEIELALINTFSKNEHADVTYKIQGGKVQHFTITKKFRLNG